MLGQMRFGLFQKLRARQRVEEINRFDLVKSPANAFSMLLRSELGSTISQGWSRGWLVACVVTNSLSTLGQPSFLLVQTLPLIFVGRRRLMQWHYPMNDSRVPSRFRISSIMPPPSPPVTCEAAAVPRKRSESITAAIFILPGCGRPASTAFVSTFLSLVKLAKS